MESSELLPPSVCGSCTTQILSAMSFIDFCKNSAHQWTALAEYLNNLNVVEGKKGYYILINGTSEPTLVTDTVRAGSASVDICKRIRRRLIQRACNIRRRDRERQLKTQGDIKSTEDETFLCPDCNTSFGNRQILDKHLLYSCLKSCRYCGALVPFSEMTEHSLSHDVIVYACDICAEPFYSLYALDAHTKVHFAGRYECKTCKYTFTSLATLKSHMNLHVSKSCPHCVQMFTNNKCLRRHMSKCVEQSSKENNGVYKCEHCESRFDSVYDFNNHLCYNGLKMCSSCDQIVDITDFESHVEDHMSVTCRKCLDTFDNMKSLEIHLESHFTPDQQCNICYNLFESVSDLVTHLKVRHKKSCPNCNKKILNPVCFDKHAELCSERNDTNFNGRVYTCLNCGAKFATYFRLYLHLKESRSRACWVCCEICPIDEFREHLRHHNVRTYNCKVCPDAFYSVAKLKSHIKIHKTRPYVCGECQHTFHTRMGLYVHCGKHQIKTCACMKLFTSANCFNYHKKICDRRSISDEEKFVCDYCGAEYTSKSVLRSHINLKHLYGFRYQCETCGKRCGARAQLREHENTHNKVSRYTCAVCGKTMSTRRGFEKHALLHSGRKPHGCPHCDSRFITDWQKKQHIMSKHRGDMVVYQCQYCPPKRRRNYLPDKLQQHLERVHGILPGGEVDQRNTNTKRKIGHGDETASAKSIEHLVERSKRPRIILVKL